MARRRHGREVEKERNLGSPSLRYGRSHVTQLAWIRLARKSFAALVLLSLPEVRAVMEGHCNVGQTAAVVQLLGRHFVLLNAVFSGTSSSSRDGLSIRSRKR